MSRSEFQTLGRFLYLKAFDQPLQDSILSTLSHQEQEKSPPGLSTATTGEADAAAMADLRALPCELYMEEFTNRYKLSSTVFKRWLNGASMDIANLCLPKMPAGRDHDPDLQAADNQHGSKTFTEQIEVLTDAVRRVAQGGLSACIGDHLSLIEEVKFQAVDSYFQQIRHTSLWSEPQSS